MFAATNQPRTPLEMQRIVLALALTGAAGLIAPQCAVRAPRAVLRAEAAEAPAEATPAPTFKVIDIPSDKCELSVQQKPGNRRQGSRAARFEFATRGAKMPTTRRRPHTPATRHHIDAETPPRHRRRARRDAVDAKPTPSPDAGPRKKKRKKSSTPRPKKRN